MTSTPFRLLLLSATAASAVSAVAQTAPHATTPAHRAAAGTAAAHTPGCAVLPAMSPKIPALPADAACPKPLYTVTRVPEIRLDYASPMVGPEVRALLGPPPSTFSLLFTEAKLGSGELAHQGKFLTVHYTGYLLDGTKFDSSLDRKEPISFQYGAHHVIPGWDTGFEGMKVGGKRRLIIPYVLAYGENGNRGIPPKATLVFDMELLKVSDEDPTPKPAPPAPRPTPPATPPAGAPGAPAATPTPAGPAGTPPVTSTTPATSSPKPDPSAPKQ